MGEFTNTEPGNDKEWLNIFALSLFPCPVYPCPGGRWSLPLACLPVCRIDVPISLTGYQLSIQSDLPEGSNLPSCDSLRTKHKFLTVACKAVLGPPPRTSQESPMPSSSLSSLQLHICILSFQPPPLVRLPPLGYFSNRATL